jgi:hypothetical protein
VTVGKVKLSMIGGKVFLIGKIPCRLVSDSERRNDRRLVAQYAFL